MWSAVMLSALLAAALGGGGCGRQEPGRHGSGPGGAEPWPPHVLRIGVCPGPYGRMVEEALAPVLMRQQIRVEVVGFTDYLQPDIALDSGVIDANLMQHQRYLDGIVREQGFGLAAVISVPTLGMGVFSHRTARWGSSGRVTRSRCPGITSIRSGHCAWQPPWGC